jgi:hypothetical protein
MITDEKEKKKEEIKKNLINEGFEHVRQKSNGASNSRSKIGLFIFNGLRDFTAKRFVNFLPLRPWRAIL